MMNNLEDVNSLLKNDAYLIPHTLKQLLKETELHAENISNRYSNKSSESDTAGDRVPNAEVENEQLQQAMNELLSVRSEVVDAISDVNLMKELVVYSNGLEKHLAGSKLQVDRLKEENIWLSEEKAHFEDQKRWFGEKIRDIKTKIAHLAFVLKHRLRLTENTSCSELSELVGVSRSNDVTSSRVDSILNEIRQKFQHGCKHQRENVKTKVTPDIMKDISVQQHTNSNRMYTDYKGPDTSNSNQVNVSEVRHNRRESRRSRTRRNQVHVTQTKQQVCVKPSVCLMSSTLSDLECDTLKRALRSIAFGGNMRSPPPDGDSLEYLVDYLLTSDHRTTMMGEIKRLLAHYKDSSQFNLVLSLGSLVLSSLRQIEQDFRAAVKTVTPKKPTVRDKSKDFQKLEITDTAVWNDNPDYMKVVEDTCHILSLLASLHFSRQELQQASQLLKESLRLRRASRTWRQPLVANSLCQLAFIDAHHEELNGAVQHAKKALLLRQELLKDANKTADLIRGQLDLAKQKTILALFLLRKSQYEQKHARYNRIPLKDAGDIRQLLTQSIKIYCKLSQNAYCGCLSFGVEDWEEVEHQITSRGTPSTLGDNLEHSISKNSENKVSRAEEGLVGVRCVLAVFHIFSRRWLKAVRQLNTNLELIDHMLPEGKAAKRSKCLNPASQQIIKMLKLTSLKGLLYIYRATEQGLKEMEVYGRIQCIDATIRPTDEITDNDLINGCQDALLVHEFD